MSLSGFSINIISKLQVLHFAGNQTTLRNKQTNIQNQEKPMKKTEEWISEHAQSTVSPASKWRMQSDTMFTDVQKDAWTNVKCPCALHKRTAACVTRQSLNNFSEVSVTHFWSPPLIHPPPRWCLSVFHSAYHFARLLYFILQGGSSRIAPNHVCFSAPFSSTLSIANVNNPTAENRPKTNQSNRTTREQSLKDIIVYPRYKQSSNYKNSN